MDPGSTQQGFPQLPLYGLGQQCGLSKWHQLSHCLHDCKTKDSSGGRWCRRVTSDEGTLRSFLPSTLRDQDWQLQRTDIAAHICWPCSGCGTLCSCSSALSVRRCHPGAWDWMLALLSVGIPRAVLETTLCLSAGTLGCLSTTEVMSHRSWHFHKKKTEPRRNWVFWQHSRADVESRG